MSKMKLAFTPIAQLQAVTENEIWKIKVRVARMWRFQNGDKTGDVGGVDLILVDDKGDRIQACIRGKLIPKFENDLGEGECCILMNFKLSPNLGNYRGTGHPFKIFFTWSTYLKKNCEEIPNDSLRFDCVSFDDLLSQNCDEKVFVDVIGEIVGPCNLKEITVRNAPCKILNLQLKNCGDSIINCVFWEKYAEDIHSYVQSFSGGAIVMLCSLMRINIYNGKFTIQSGKSSTKLFINSDIAEINEFKEKMSKDVMSTTSCGSQLTLSNCTQVSLDHIPFENRKTISQLLTSYEETRCCIYATICALKTEGPWWYLACPGSGCAKKVNYYLNPETEELEMDKFSCEACEKIVSSTKTRYQVHCKVLDHTGTASFLMFDREVIQLIHKSAYELLEQQVQFNNGNELPRELLALEGREFVFTVYKPETSKNYTPSTFKVVNVTDDPAKILRFHSDDANESDIPAIGPHFSNSTETTTNLVNDVLEESNNSTSASTESASTPTTKRPSTLAIEDCVPQLSSKKLKGDVSLLAEEDGQLSSTKIKTKSWVCD
ncbi:replication protein A 70 kDa DNA-binding subunit A-like [Raphanus sativus]|uniref:Replication protein A 70 kDa DNA-binding subunit A-like n=1 Tax=Raphanus sativus TaxID=3726 RepID=A0A9W3CF81_RAPSA|nr:replication protein A 70 kDa DNA-binding subunit A-like [Raphanus sativus]XP_056850156.1 replication protein A 70 kDa DNA-binding subunit A-like [Raphanus sativus]